MKRELPLPDGAAEDLDAFEVARIWVTRQDLLVSLNIGLYPPEESAGETTAWGDILADTVKHLAKALSLRYDQNPAVLEQEIIARCNLSLGQFRKDISGSLKDCS
ncbi:MULTISPECIES: DUF5076 domain-containing protein [Xanthomonas]|uniref:DUF5076 domain-containing protein n=1 Tax=Xanthomonas TaxID=338 RepID=UPI000E5C49B0|nr:MULTISPECIES: DUF5076 domain-containing protein [Xanthomonas]CAD1786735.1 DUF5076 domain-containing protein [Xanthomonas sp. CPBF 426]CAG2083378.1 DUF5076 domain-containing protein [Xanthomonas euroxanthea]